MRLYGIIISIIRAKTPRMLKQQPWRLGGLAREIQMPLPRGEFALERRTAFLSENAWRLCALAREIQMPIPRGEFALERRIAFLSENAWRLCGLARKIQRESERRPHNAYTPTRKRSVIFIDRFIRRAKRQSRSGSRRVAETTEPIY